MESLEKELSSAHRTRSRKLLGIQYLRGIAALLVVFSHIGYLFPLLGHNFDIGAIGVDIFFVISGFVMWITTGNLTAYEFILRRLYRIAPLYWIVTAGVSVIGIAGISFGVHPTWPDFFKSISFIAYANPEHGDRIVPIVGVGWTLNLEMMFYGIFALSIAWVGNLRFLFISIVLSCLFLAAEFTRGSNEILMFYGQSIILEFLAGMALGILYLNHRLACRTPLIALGLLGFIWVYFTLVTETDIRLLYYGVPAILVVYVVVALEEMTPYAPRLLLLGDASYSIYLTHKMAVLFYFTLTLKGVLPGNTILAWVLATALSLVVGVMTYKLVERPLVALTGRRAVRQRSKLQ